MVCGWFAVEVEEQLRSAVTVTSPHIVVAIRLHKYLIPLLPFFAGSVFGNTEIVNLDATDSASVEFTFTEGW